ncbi:MAG TPA: hypothetical protein VGL34_02465 [Steroidobacteraceae bacterium]|jgi:hypothetical protein
MEQEVMKAIPRASRIKWVVAFVGIGIVMAWAWKAIVGPELRVIRNLMPHPWKPGANRRRASS